jgi:hypothetical protein
MRTLRAVTSHVLRIYIRHDNGERPHRPLELCPPKPKRSPESTLSKIHRHDLLGGVIHELSPSGRMSSRHE